MSCHVIWLLGLHVCLFSGSSYYPIYVNLEFSENPRESNAKELQEVLTPWVFMFQGELLYYLQQLWCLQLYV